MKSQGGEETAYSSSLFTFGEGGNLDRALEGSGSVQSVWTNATFLSGGLVETRGSEERCVCVYVLCLFGYVGTFWCGKEKDTNGLIG